MRAADLIALRQTANPCYTEVLSLDDLVKDKEATEAYKRNLYEGLVIHLDGKNSTWNFEGGVLPIGKGTTSHVRYDCGFSLIGIYDRTNTSHLTNMLRDSQKVTSHG